MDWGKRIKLTFDRKVYYVNGDSKNYFRLIETIYGTYIYPNSVGYGENENELYLDFEDINQSVEPLTLEYLGGSNMGSADLPMSPFTISVVIKNFNYFSGWEYLAMSDVSFTGEIVKPFDGKAYGDEYLQMGLVSIGGMNNILGYTELYQELGYLEMGNIVMSGAYCDVNGIPI